MYRIEDEISAIKEVQRLLGLKMSGIYDSATRNAVLDIQKRRGLPPSGVTDYRTFIMIVDEYRRKRNSVWDGNFLSSASFPFPEGSQGDNAGRINEALATVLKSYAYEGVIPRGKYIGQDTLSGVLFLNRIFGIGERDEIDEAFMNRLMLELKAIEIKDKYS
jgi:hypothetical protein